MIKETNINEKNKAEAHLKNKNQYSTHINFKK